MKITGQDGAPARKAVGERIRELLKGAFNGRVALGAMLKATKAHVSAEYPGSKHWDPAKIVPGKYSQTAAEAEVNIPGAGRAYHDVTIVPRTRKYLKIPLGGKARDDRDMFVLTAKSGRKFLASRDGNGVTLAYLLADKAFQPRKPGLMPSDEAFAKSVFAAVAEALESER